METFVSFSASSALLAASSALFAASSALLAASSALFASFFAKHNVFMSFRHGRFYRMRRAEGSKQVQPTQSRFSRPDQGKKEGTSHSQGGRLQAYVRIARSRLRRG